MSAGSWWAPGNQRGHTCPLSRRQEDSGPVAALSSHFPRGTRNLKLFKAGMKFKRFKDGGAP